MTMPAVRWHGRLDVRLDEVPEPGTPGPGMVTVAVAWCGICGTDVSEYQYGPLMIRNDLHPLTGRAPPITLGHEFSGRVTALGEGVEGVAEGQRVVIDACWRCGRCPFCLRGDYHLCLQGGSVGLHSDGGLAPLAQVPAYTVVPVPDTVPDRTAALTEPLAVALHALDQARLAVGGVAVVVGFGPVGAAVGLLARQAGVRVLVAEAGPGRRALAGGLGFEEVFDPAAQDLRRQVRGRTGGLGADAVVDCTGKQSVVASSVELARRGGTIVVVGLGPGPASLDTNRLVLFERRLVGSLGYRHDLPRVLSLLERGVPFLEALVTDDVPLKDAASWGLQALAADPDAHLKILVRGS